eukprot:1606860-Pyramimonas_sp.AAC.1
MRCFDSDNGYLTRCGAGHSFVSTTPARSMRPASSKPVTKRWASNVSGQPMIQNRIAMSATCMRPATARTVADWRVRSAAETGWS